MSDSDPSPWASDEIPPSDGLGEIVWDTAPDDAAVVVNDQPDRQRRWIIGGATAVAGLLIVITAVALRSDEPVIGDLGLPIDTASDTTVTRTPNETGSALPTAVIDAAALPEPGTSTDLVNEPGATFEASLSRVVLPDALAEIAVDTQLVAQGADGQLHVISIPSGDAMTFDLAVDSDPDFRSIGDPSITISPHGIMIGETSDTVSIITSDGQLKLVDPAGFGDPGGEPVSLFPVGWLEHDDSSSFLVLADPGSATVDEFLVTVDGSVTSVESVALDRSIFPQFAYGEILVNDAGGIYRVDADGVAERISDGQLIASSESALLIRECDDTRTCQSVVTNRLGEQRRTVTLPDEVNTFGFGVSLSPRGDAVAYTTFGETSERRIVDLATGDEVATSNNYDLTTINGAWAGDDSGEFRPLPGAGLKFVDRETGEATVFGLELGRITALATRAAT